MFLGYIHYFRALAIFFIVAGHSIDVFSWENNEAGERLIRIYASNGSTLFVFIAGYLFQHLSIKYKTLNYYKSKATNVLLPYILVSIPAIYVFTEIMHREEMFTGFYDNPVWLQVVLFYLTGKHLAPLWFVPMITLFYVVAPLLIIADKKRHIYYLLPLFILLSCFVERGLPHQSFVHFFSVYLLGMYCSKDKEIVNATISQSCFLSISLILIIFLGIFEFIFTDRTMTFYNLFQKMIMSLFFLGLFFRLNEKLKSKFISLIADTSFGVFFIHSYLLTGSKMLYKNFFGQLPAGNLVEYIALSIVFLLASVAVIQSIKMVFGKYSRYLVGS